MTSASTEPVNARLDYLDAVRAFALLLGVVFHAAMSFLPVFIGWAVMDVSTSPLVSGFALVSHSFRMELFFLIAGYFSHMTFHRNGARSFVLSRVLRIGIPFVIGWFALRPLLVSGWVMGGQSLRGQVDILAGLAAGYGSLASLPAGLFVGTHLWFLYYLLLITAIILAARAVLGLWPALARSFTRQADAVMQWVVNRAPGWIVLLIPTTICLWWMDGWGMDTPDKSLAPDLPVLAVYTGFFVFGWLLHRQPALMDRFARLSAWRVVALVALIALTLVLAKFQLQPAHPRFGLFRAIFVFGYAGMMWGLVAVTIGLFRRFLDRPSPGVRYVADGSYWLYLVHLPLVVWLQVAVAEWPLHWAIKLPFIAIVTVVVALLAYDLFVRSTFIGRVLNGRRRPRQFSRAAGQGATLHDTGGFLR